MIHRNVITAPSDHGQGQNDSKSPLFKAAAGEGYNPNPQGKKVVFIVGNSISAHRVLQHSLRELAGMGIPCEVYLTNPLPKTDRERERLQRPEVMNMAFAEKLIIEHGYPLLENNGIILNSDGELIEDLVYTPRQLANYFTARGVHVSVQDLPNVNDPSFIEKISNDPDIAVAYNIRSLQILEKEAIAAFENKTIYDRPTMIINLHPADVILFPGAGTPLWVRKSGVPNATWTLHKMIRRVDWGPIIDECTQTLRNGKTLLQDTVGMASKAASMVINHATQTLKGSYRADMQPQQQHPNFSRKPKKQYTHGEHKDWLEAEQQGITAVNFLEFIKAVVKEHVGNRTKLATSLTDSLIRPTRDWQELYVKMYTNVYGYPPLGYDPQAPDEYLLPLISPSNHTGGGRAAGATANITAAWQAEDVSGRHGMPANDLLLDEESLYYIRDLHRHLVI